MPQSHKISDAKQVRRTTKELRIGVFKMFYYLNLKCSFFLKKIIKHRYQKVKEKTKQTNYC